MEGVAGIKSKQCFQGVPFRGIRKQLYDLTKWTFLVIPAREKFLNIGATVLGNLTITSLKTWADRGWHAWEKAGSSLSMLSESRQVDQLWKAARCKKKVTGSLAAIWRAFCPSLRDETMHGPDNSGVWADSWVCNSRTKAWFRAGWDLVMEHKCTDRMWELHVANKGL